MGAKGGGSRTAVRGQEASGFARSARPAAARSASGAGCALPSASSRDLRALAHWRLSNRANKE